MERILTCVVAVSFLFAAACESDGGNIDGGATSDSELGDDSDSETSDSLGDLPDLPSINCEDSGTPGEYVSSEKYRTISAGVEFGCGIQTDDELACWGRTRWVNNIGDVSGNFSSIDTASEVVCALSSDGEASCWGRAREGLLEPPNPPDRQWKMLDVGLQHGCGIYQDHRVGCWGKDGPATSRPDEKFNDIAVSHFATCAIKRNDHTIECWGKEKNGHLRAPGGKFAAIDGNGDAFCALTYEGKPKCWGNLAQFSPPSEVEFSDIQASAFACGHRADGVPTCWPSEKDSEELTPSGSEERCFQEWSLGRSYACGIRADGKAECFGKGVTEEDGRLEVP